MKDKMITSCGVLTNLDKPRAGVIGVNDQLLTEYVHDMLDINEMIDLTYEEYCKELEESGKPQHDIDECLENYESDDTIYLVGNWTKDDEGCYIPDKENGEFAATYNTAHNTICVEWSKHTRKVHHTSPCYVMADGSGPCGDLSEEGEVLAYDLPKDWYRKYDILSEIELTARNAANFRLRGQIQDALEYDGKVEQLYQQAKCEGIEEDYIIEYEEKGREAAREWHDKNKGQTL